MRRHAVTDVALGLVFVGVGAALLLMAIVEYVEPYRCNGLPCDFHEVISSRSPIVTSGLALLFFGIGARMIWNVWRKQG